MKKRELLRIIAESDETGRAAADCYGDIIDNLMDRVFCHCQVLPYTHKIKVYGNDECDPFISAVVGMLQEDGYDVYVRFGYEGFVFLEIR